MVAETYRFLMILGDNFGDFVDGYKGSLAERQALADKHQDLWGSKWIVIANPTYGSWESAPFGHDYKQSGDLRRKMKSDAMTAWEPK